MQRIGWKPALYTEASLIKALEENGIGRPSTYATTISTITAREYVTRENKTLKPTELGEVITKLMKEHFPKIVNIKFTAQVESELDEVEHGKEEWTQQLHTFYDEFSDTLKKAKEAMDGVKIQLEQVVTANSLHVPVIPNARISKRLSMKQARNAQNAAAESL